MYHKNLLLVGPHNSAGTKEGAQHLRDGTT